MPSFTADNQNKYQYEEVVVPEKVTRLQLTAGPPIDVNVGSYSEKEITVPNDQGRDVKIEMFRATCPDGQVLIGKTQSIVGMWMSFGD